MKEKGEKACEARRRQTHGVFHIIKRQLSRQSWARVQAHKDFPDVDRTIDPNGLWFIIVGTNVLNTKEKDEYSAKIKAQLSFSQFRMAALESLEDFKVRFELRLQIYVSMWSTGTEDELKLSDPTAAAYFIDKLDPDRYGAIQQNFKNKIYVEMATVHETFEFINSLTIPKKQSRPVVYKSEDPKRKSADDHGRGGRNRVIIGRICTQTWRLKD